MALVDKSNRCGSLSKLSLHLQGSAGVIASLRKIDTSCSCLAASYTIRLMIACLSLSALTILTIYSQATAASTPSSTQTTAADSRTTNAQAVDHAATATTSHPAESAAAANNTAATARAPSTAGSDTHSQTESRTVAPSEPDIPHILIKHGQELSVGTDAQDLVPTDDVSLARQQVVAYPDSPEASFILAVALTRTSHVEESLQEVRRAKKLAAAKGGTVYFDQMINSYEEMLKNFPQENRVRYGLAWAYYMKAYLLSQESQKIQKWNAAQAALAASAHTVTSTPAATSKPTNFMDLAAAAVTGSANGSKPHIEGALEKAEPSLRPQIKKYYEAALTKLDELLAAKPDDIWAGVYRAFLRAEYTGNLEEAMATWQSWRDRSPNNPAPYFFLGEGYLKQGNLKESLSNVSKAIALRSIGN